MVKDMGMTNKQFQGFIRLALELLERAAQKSPDNEDLKKVRDIFQSMLEDGNWSAINIKNKKCKAFWMILQRLYTFY